MYRGRRIGTEKGDLDEVCMCVRRRVYIYIYSCVCIFRLMLFFKTLLYVIIRTS